jgi:cobalt-zinc-cadmium efflux system outer membrane protein
MRTRGAWFAVLVYAYTCAPAAAQAVLSERDALARISPDSPRVRALRAGVEVARADVMSVGRWPNPRVAIEREAVAGVSEVLTTVLQPLPITGRRQLERAAASTSVDAAAHRADEDVRRLRADVRLAYADLAAAQVRERELTRSRERLQALTAILEKREAAGDAAGFDRLRAEREVLDVEADRLIAAADRARAQASLAGFLSPGTDPTGLVTEERRSPQDLPALEALIELAYRTRGELLALQKDLDASRLSFKAAERRRIPEPEILGGSKSSSAGGGDIGTVIGVQATIPLFDHGKAEQAVAQARASQAAARLESLRLTTAADIGAARVAVVTRRQAAEQFRTASLTNSNEIERIAQVSYDAGERGILELLDAFRMSSAARVRQAALDAAVRESEIELEYLSGWEIP